MLNLFATLGAVAAIAVSPMGLALQSPQIETPALEADMATALSASERSRILARASQALSKVTTARGTFEQLAPDFTVTTGRFALSRPGKMRFDYDDPTPLVMVSDGATVALQDSELETTDRVPLQSTPLALLLDDQINFETDADILDVTRDQDRVGITLRDKSGEMDGTLTLLLMESNMDLTGWRTEDTGGNITSVMLTNVEYGKRLNPRLFVLKDYED